MKSLISSFAILVAAVAQAEYMMWSVNESDIDSSILSQVAYMRVGYVIEQGDPPAWEGYSLDSYNAKNVNKGTDIAYHNGAVYQVSLTGVTDPDYAFYIELLNSSGEVIGRTGNEEKHLYTTYSQLQDGNYVATGDIGTTPAANIWHGGTFSAVPEPSSMALLALGAGLVGLRRKLKKGKKGKCA